MFRLEFDKGWALADLRPDDAPLLVEHLREREIYERTLAIPYPYTPDDAVWWIDRVAKEAERQGHSLSWAIREPRGRLVGALGFHEMEIGNSHRAEIGYWLAKPYWGRGIATKAVRAASAYAFKEFGLWRITAHIFAFNTASGRVLEKAGYRLEGVLRQHYNKDNKIQDSKLYARLSSDPDGQQQ